jgi:N,N-dimethylformamidase beta subunit-like, C-terminal/FlgD Ig-like domain
VNRAAGFVFAAFVLAVAGGLVAAARLARTPNALDALTSAHRFSPNRDGRLDTAPGLLRVARADDVRVSVLDAAGDEVRVLDPRRVLAAGAVGGFAWDGRLAGGAVAPDGRYRVRVVLRREGRSFVAGAPTRLDTTPPRPRVEWIGPYGTRGPEILPLPGARPAEVHLRTAERPTVRVFAMAPGSPRPLLEARLPDRAATWSWNGRDAHGRPVGPGTYLVAVQTLDRAGNLGASPPLGRDGLPATTYGMPLPGQGGVTVRTLAIQPPSVPVSPGAVATFGVDARRRAYGWTLRRAGSPAVLRSGRTTSPALRVRVPAGGGLYTLTARSRAGSATVPVAVRSRVHRSVLVVLPVMTWQGRNALDDDGDGLPNVLDRGLAAKADRVYAGPVADLARRDEPLLAWLDRTRRAYDVTTDVALARGVGPTLRGHTGVLLTSDARWLPRATLLALRRFAQRGGTVASLGVDALRRQVSLSNDGVLYDPTPAAAVDAFGAALRPVTRADPRARLVESSDSIQFFAGTTGAFSGFGTLQELASPGPGATVVAAAQTERPQTGRAVISATRLGDGIVIRLPLPELPGRLAGRAADPQVVALLERTWTLLSH